MAKQRAPLEFNSLGGGLITEANALTFPDGASIDEDNFELNRDGSRTRRLGMEYESLDTLIATFGNFYSDDSFGDVNSFLWKNVAGRGDVDILAVQVKWRIFFYLSGGQTISEGRIPEYIGAPEGWSGRFSFANIDGNLVVATGSSLIMTIVPSFDGTDTIPSLSPQYSPLTIRDLFGTSVTYNRAVEGDTPELPDYIDLNDPTYVTKRPLESGLPSSSVGEIVEYTAGSSVFYSAPNYTMHRTLSEFNPTSISGFIIEKAVYDGLSNPIGSGWTDFTIYFDRNNPAPSFTTLLATIGDTEYTLTSSGSHAFTTSYPGSWQWPDPSETYDTFTVSSLETASSYNYNLRNQSFSIKRYAKTGETLQDPIELFLAQAGKYPSMSDTVGSALYNNLDATNKTVDRYHAEDAVVNPLGSFPSAKGYFIIDALDRSSSREVAWRELVGDQEYSEAELSSLPPDRTPGGARVVAEYSGRAWYGGFSEEGTDTEAGGIRLESFLLYSQFANTKSALTRCYQKGDPTSQDGPELLETDGGFLSLDGAYGISKLVPLGNSLMVFAENGIWAVSGLDGNSFTPTSPRIQKITERGSISPTSVVVVDTAVVYWAKDGIYLVSLSTVGDYKVDSLTEKTIQTYYNDIPYLTKRDVIGAYDSYASEIVWAINNKIDRDEPTVLLKLQIITGAFTKHTLYDGLSSRTVFGPVETTPFSISTSSNTVTVDAATVTVNAEDVTIHGFTIESRTTDIKYIFSERVDEANNAAIGFASLTSPTFADWGEADAPAYMLTGYVSGGDFQRNKQVPYITFHFDRTEDGFELVEGDIVPSHQSSCLVQAQWDWANSVNSGRWSRAFQAYRYKRHFIPVDVSDTYDYGFETITTKNKIRGKGRVLSLKLESEEGKDCRILGWSAIMEVNGNV